MALQFVFGPSGGGKSHYLYETIIEEAARDRTKDFLLIVPEQFTMRTQKELVERSEGHAIMNIDVLSFERLAFRVFDELGMYKIRVLEETGKNLVLKKLAQRQENGMRVIGKNLKKMGYISEMKSLISEFMQYQITPEEVEQWTKDESYSQAFRMKMQDVLLIYRSFLDYLAGDYVTSEEILEECAKAADRSLMLADCHLIFDGFTGFTPVQVSLLRTLFPLADRIWAAVTLDARQDPWQMAGMQDLFYMSHKMIHVLSGLADDARCEILEPVWVERGREFRYGKAEALFHLEQNLFRNWQKPYLGKQEEIEIQSCKNPGEEMEYIASYIRRLVQEGGYRYRDFAIVSGGIELYGNYIKRVFEAYEIPYFVDEKKTILFHPFIEFVRASLEIIEDDFSYESVMRYFRSGLSLLDTEEIDILENYILAAGVRGRRKWEREFEKCPKGYKEEELEEINALRGRFMEEAGTFVRGFQAAGTTVAEKTSVLYEFILAHRMEERLREFKERFEAEKDYAAAKEYEQIYGIVMDLLDKIVDLLGEEVFSVEEYGDILDAGFEAAKVGVIPPGYDCVLLGDIERTRLEDIRVLFFAGVNDGIIPKSNAGGGVLTALEREALLEKEIQLAPTPRERVFIQKFYLYLNMTKPGERLILTYARVDAQGRAIRPSYLTAQIKKLYPDITIGEEHDRAGSLITPKSSMTYFLKGLASEKREEEFPAWNALAGWYLQQGSWAAPAAELIETAFAVFHERRLPRDLVHELYGRVLESSVTRLERYAACACAHYLQYGLGLLERPVWEFTPADFGNIFHTAIEEFSRGLQRAGKDWNDLDEKLSASLEEESFARSLERNQTASLFDSERSRFMVGQMRRVYHRTLETLTSQIQRGRFRPQGYEVGFAAADHLESVQFLLSEEERMHLRGRIDRLDTYETETNVYVKIIDYKTGSTNFQLINLYHGLQLQLVVYLNAALERVQRDHPDKRALPAGIFYYHVDEPYVEGRHLSEEEIAEAMMEKLKLDGVVNSSEEVYRAMDEQMGSASSVIPVKLKKDGTLSSVSKALPVSDLLRLGAYADQKIEQIGREMLAGNVQAKPYLMEKRSACDYCSFAGVCGFDEKIPGYRYRQIETGLKNEEILDKIKQDLINKNDIGEEEGEHGMDERTKAGD